MAYKYLNKIIKIGFLFLAVSSMQAGAVSRAPDQTVIQKIDDWVDGRVKHLLAGAASAGPGWGAVVLLPDLHAREWTTYLYLRALAVEDPERAAAADRLAEAWLQLLDPVWGGVYALSPGREVSGDFPAAVMAPADSDYEKRLSDQAGALQVFASAYEKTRESRYLRAIERVDAYLLEWLADGEGLFFAGQWWPAGRTEDDARPQIEPAAYWDLPSEHQRRQFGLPERAPDKPLQENASLAIAYQAAARVIAEPNFLALARRIEARLQTSGHSAGVNQAAPSEPDDRQRMLFSTLAWSRASLPDEIDVSAPLPEGVVALGLLMRSTCPEGSNHGLGGEPEGELQAGGEG